MRALGAVRAPGQGLGRQKAVRAVVAAAGGGGVMNHGELVFLVTAVLLPLAISEFSDWCPRLAHWLVRWSARRLDDPDARARYEEEWAANLDEVPGKLSRLLAALGYLVAVPRMRQTLRRVSITATKPSQLRAPSFTQFVRFGEIAVLDRRLADWRQTGRRDRALVTPICGVGGNRQDQPRAVLGSADQGRFSGRAVLRRPSWIHLGPSGLGHRGLGVFPCCPTRVS